MENTFDPAHRKWISPLVTLERCMTEMKRLVRMRKDDVVIGGPVPMLSAADGGYENIPGFEDPSSEYTPDFMKAEAMKVDIEEPVVETGAVLTDEGNDEGNKWSPSDAACEAAVELVGGTDYFIFGKKKKPEDGKRQRGRKAKVKEPVEDVEDEDEQAEAADEEMEQSAPTCSKTVRFQESREGRKSESADNDCVQSEATKFHDDKSEDDTESSDDENEEEKWWWQENDTACSAAIAAFGGDGFEMFVKNKISTEENNREATLEVDDSQGSRPVDENDEGSDPTRINPPKFKGKQENRKKEAAKDAISDFKRFTDWVFDQNGKRDAENKQSVRPAMMERVGGTEELVKALLNNTSAQLTSVRGEVFQDIPVMQSSSMPLLAPPTNIQARTTLQSLAIFLTHGEDPSVFPWKSINVQQQMNDDFVNHQLLTRMEQQKKDITNPAMKNELVNKEDDFLVQILIYQSTDPDDVLTDEVKMYVEPKLAYELHVLGSQTVKDLFKSFHCENDYVCLKDVPHPDNYKEDPTSFAKSHLSNSMILIHDVVYCDPTSDVDYVSIINEWAAKPPEKNIGPFERGDWNTKLKDLKLCFGFPYVYIHLGGCEHIYVFTKSRLLHVEDDHLIKSYPKIVGMTRYKNVYCRVDNEYLARWAVLDFKEFPENPMLLCTDCVQKYCYDNKKKRGNFKLYPFTQLANIL